MDFFWPYWFKIKLLKIANIFFSIMFKIYILGAQNNCLDDTVFLSTQNIYICIKEKHPYPFLKKCLFAVKRQTYSKCHLPKNIYEHCGFLVNECWRSSNVFGLSVSPLSQIGSYLAVYEPV